MDVYLEYPSRMSVRSSAVILDIAVHSKHPAGILGTFWDFQDQMLTSTLIFTCWVHA